MYYSSWILDTLYVSQSYERLREAVNREIRNVPMDLYPSKEKRSYTELLLEANEKTGSITSLELV
jgi:hypothetical protein